MEENRYLLTMMVAKRAKQLLAGAKPLIKTKFKNPVSIALKESNSDNPAFSPEFSGLPFPAPPVSWQSSRGAG